VSREAEEEQSTLRFQAKFDSAKTTKKLKRGETNTRRGLFQQPASYVTRFAWLTRQNAAYY
jgi:hypothetical protein